MSRKETNLVYMFNINIIS